MESVYFRSVHMKSYFWCLICSLILGNFNLFAERENIYIPREDGTIIEAYFDRPDQQEEFPVVVFIDGSYETSVIINHAKLANRLTPRKIGIISLEKRGITSNTINQNEFRAHDCFEERLQDYFLLLNQIKNQKISGCTGRVILLGGSEGGKIAPRLSLYFSNIVQGVVLVGSGGGLSFAEEMKYQLQQLIQQRGVVQGLSYKLRNFIFPKEIDQHCDKMLKNPNSLEIYSLKTWKWWASYLRYDLLSDLLKIDVPIYMIHGGKDVRVPIKSADLIEEAFHQAGKTNLHYARYKDLGHGMREDAYPPMLDWICKKSFSHPSVDITAQ